MKRMGLNEWRQDVSETRSASLESHAAARAERIPGPLRAAVLMVFAYSFSPSPAMAQGNVVTISEVTIVGRVQKPIAAVDVARIRPKMTLAKLRQPFLDRIEKAIYRAPF